MPQSFTGHFVGNVPLLMDFCCPVLRFAKHDHHVSVPDPSSFEQPRTVLAERGVVYCVSRSISLEFPRFSIAQARAATKRTSIRNPVEAVGIVRNESHCKTTQEGFDRATRSPRQNLGNIIQEARRDGRRRCPSPGELDSTSFARCPSRAGHGLKHDAPQSSLNDSKPSIFLTPPKTAQDPTTRCEPSHDSSRFFLARLFARQGGRANQPRPDTTASPSPSLTTNKETAPAAPRTHGV